MIVTFKKVALGLNGIVFESSVRSAVLHWTEVRSLDENVQSKRLVDTKVLFG